MITAIAPVAQPTPFMGVLMLETRFTRFPGDVGHAATWPFPVHFHVVEGASVAEATGADPHRLLAPFIAAGQMLAARGARALTTSCGFLAVHQKALAAALPVPMASSALLQAPMITASLPPGQTLGVLTFRADTLSAAHLSGAGCDPTVPVVGLAPDSAMREDILGGAPAGFAAREADVLRAATELREKTPNLGAVLCECTNFSPHSDAIRRKLGLPVFDIVTLVSAVARTVGVKHDAVAG
jgi:hypothetical protein